MALPCLRWHGFAFGLGRHIFLSHKHTHTLIQEGNTGSQRCLETHTDTHKYTQRATLISCLALLSSEWHSWRIGLFSGPTMQTNKHSMHSVSPSSLINTLTTLYRQPFTNNNVWQKTAYLDHYHLNYLITCFLLFFFFLFLPAPFLLSLAVHPSDAPYVSSPVSISAFIKRNGFFLASQSGVDCLAGLAQCWAIQQVNMFYQPHGSWLTKHTDKPRLVFFLFCFLFGFFFRGNLEMDIFFWLQQTDGSVCAWRAHFAKNNTNPLSWTLL